jgi:hypothetical protein
MKRNHTKLSGVLALFIGFAASGAAQDITQAERSKALTYLDSTRDALTGTAKGLSEAQWSFKPAPEHLAVLEDIFASKLSTQLMHAPAGKPDRDFKSVDAMILATVPDRSMKVHAPENLTPTGRWTPDESLRRFLASRRETISFLASNADLRGHVLNHPALGPLDGYEWLLAVAAHTERHTSRFWR